MVEYFFLVSLGGKRLLNWQRSTLSKPNPWPLVRFLLKAKGRRLKEGLDAKPDYQIKYPTPILLTVPEGHG
jgi:hypothetical protein